MDPAISAQEPKEQRILAAIVFTDVVGFSRLAAQNETRVFVALQRDMAVMTDLCRAHGGQVLNTMGDGMLLCFTSAVDAMSCACEIQRTFFAQSKSLPPTEILHHRIGVHLGDIIVKGDNVFGDGVNVAARLQNDARPDSIWYSGTVHEIVRNKLKLNTNFIGKRQFKNLGEPVVVCEVPPIGEAEAGAHLAASGAFTSSTIPGESPGLRTTLLTIAILVLIVGFGLVFKSFKPTGAGKRPDQVRKATGTRPVGDTGSADSTTTGGFPPPQQPLTAENAQTKLDGFKNRKDFTDAVQFLSSGESQNLPNRDADMSTYTKLSELWTWLRASFQVTTADHVKITGPQGLEDLYWDGTQGLVCQPSGQSATPVDMASLTVPEIDQSIQWFVDHPMSGQPQEQAGDWRTTFDSVYGPQNSDSAGEGTATTGQ
jgi:class 3 adenylate cyclase